MPNTPEGHNEALATDDVQWLTGGRCVATDELSGTRRFPAIYRESFRYAEFHVNNLLSASDGKFLRAIL